MKVGVLALQGAFAEHIKILSNLGVEAFPVRLPSDLIGIDSLIIPGGESTTISKLLTDYHLREPLLELIRQGMPVLGICAGMILLAKRILGSEVDSLGAVDVEVKRNAFGRQVDSFEIDLNIPVLGEKPFHGVFIRAPIVQKTFNGVQVLCQFNSQPVVVRQENVIGATFHPELTDDLRFHEYFIEVVNGKQGCKK